MRAWRCAVVLRPATSPASKSPRQQRQRRPAVVQVVLLQGLEQALEHEPALVLELADLGRPEDQARPPGGRRGSARARPPDRSPCRSGSGWSRSLMKLSRSTRRTGLDEGADLAVHRPVRGCPSAMARIRSSDRGDSSAASRSWSAAQRLTRSDGDEAGVGAVDQVIQASRPCRRPSP